MARPGLTSPSNLRQANGTIARQQTTRSQPITRLGSSSQPVLAGYKFVIAVTIVRNSALEVLVIYVTASIMTVGLGVLGR